MMIVILYFSAEINIDILMWIITILNFSTEISDIEPSQVLVMLLLSTQINTEILTWIIAIVKFIPELVI